MRVWLIAIILATSVAWGCGVHPTYGQDLPPQPDFYSGSVKSKTYIRLAAELQALGREAAELRLHEIARDEHSPGKAIILCRMLLKKGQRNYLDGLSLAEPRLWAGPVIRIGLSNRSSWSTAFRS
jgi:hypothetical protein